jgi:hypothetical protein
VANDFASFAKRMRKRADALDGLGNTVVIEATDAMLRELVEVTPVDTSEALSNWQVGIGARPGGPRDPYFSGRRGSTRGASSAKAIEDGLAAIKAKRPGQSVYLSNAAPHIGDLDDGSSTQFAGGFINRSLIVFRVTFQATVKRLLK